MAAVRIGIDMDGVLCACVPGLVRKCEEVTGRDVFGDDKLSPDFPPVWDFPLAYGHTPEEYKAIWADIGKDPWFWQELGPEPRADEVVRQLWALREDLTRDVEVYFITNRFGIRPKRQSEEWLRHHGFEAPTVLVVGSAEEKAYMIATLGLEAYIDDRLTNVNVAAETIRANHMLTRIYLLDQPWNQEGVLGNDAMGADVLVRRVRAVRDMLIAEGLTHGDR